MNKLLHNNTLFTLIPVSGVLQDYHSACHAAACGDLPVFFYSNLQRICNHIDFFADTGKNDAGVGITVLYQ